MGPSGVAAVGEWVRGILAGVGVASATAEVFVRKRFRQLSVCAKGCLALSAFVRVGVCAVVAREWVGGVLVGVLGLGQALGLSVGGSAGIGAGIGAGRGCGALSAAALKRATSSICRGPPSLDRTVFQISSGMLRSGTFRMRVMRFSRAESFGPGQGGGAGAGSGETSHPVGFVFFCFLSLSAVVVVTEGEKEKTGIG